ncbi:hypothetical protein X798_04907 [Onchocerca flexuosa]|uniref:Uncharacterized protein n=2 Tax=Onchocerca flexuosa TaxID=387005 RepID=A0A183I403_9BILA|nr:hypothetical protein X798_04907 [Onchocerca flexuosa]VDP17183.1 unnamed protein product [Onchocerca flexuosa]
MEFDRKISYRYLTPWYAECRIQRRGVTRNLTRKAQVKEDLRSSACDPSLYPSSTQSYDLESTSKILSTGTIKRMHGEDERFLIRIPRES